jgi:hypothetical protein
LAAKGTDAKAYFPQVPGPFHIEVISECGWHVVVMPAR